MIDGVRMARNYPKHVLPLGVASDGVIVGRFVFQSLRVADMEGSPIVSSLYVDAVLVAFGLTGQKIGKIAVVFLNVVGWLE